MMTKAHAKAGLSRADLLWSFAVVDKAQYVEIAELLGFEERPEKQAAENNLSMDIVATFPTLSAKIELSTEVTKLPIQAPQQSPSYCRITARQRGPDAEQEEPVDTRHEWYQNADADYFSKEPSSIPVIHQTAPQYRPLMSWSRLWPFLYRVLGTSHAGLKPDVNKLVNQVAAAKAIRRVPRLQHSGWSEFATILIDINDKNFPYRNEFFYLCEQLKKMRGEQGLDIQYLNDEPGGYVIRYQNQREHIEPWCMPNAETPLLILSDLGMHSKSRRALYGWLVFGQQLKIHGCRPVVLMPVAARDIDRRLLQYFDCVVWDRTSQLKLLTEPTLAQTSEQNQQHLDTLLTYFFPAVRIDAGLVRAIRQLLPANQYDIGHEVALWQHPAVIQLNDQWGWQASSREQYMQKFVDLYLALTEEKQQKLLNLLGQYHAQLPEELYFEAMSAFLHTEQLKKLLPAKVCLATEQFMANLVKTYIEYPEHQGLDSFTQRYLSRHNSATQRLANPYTRAFFISDKQRHAQSAQISWPEDIKPEEILAFINSKQVPKTFLLRQQGQSLQLIAQEQLQQQSSDWGNPGVTLAYLILTDTQIMHLQAQDNGSLEQVSSQLQTEQAIDLGLLNTNTQRLQIGTEIFSIESAMHMENLPWAFSRGMGEKGISYVETVDKDGNVYRWYWHPPEWSQDQGMLRGVWYMEKPGEITTPIWAEQVGRDQYGMYADIEIKAVSQRLRWIEPGQFEMGSPGGEPERGNNETLHTVTLSQGYWLADTACTKALWQRIMGENPSRFTDEAHPVERLSWENVKDFILKVNKIHSGLALVFPTEAQWEYACRAGTVTPFSFGENITPEQVNYDGSRPYHKGEQGQKRGETVVVKSLPANLWGLYEMHGNVWEWCQDWYNGYSSEQQLDPAGAENGDRRVLRGGSWFLHGRFVRSAVRNDNSPGSRNNGAGFRLARGHQVQPVRKLKNIPDASSDSRVSEQRQSGLVDGIKKLFGNK